MKKILFPTDFSEAAKNGFRYAVALAQDMEAELDIMNVFSIHFTAPDEMPPDYIEQLIEEQKQHAIVKMDAFVRSVSPDFKGRKTTIYGVFIPEEINAKVKADSYDLVIMGIKGERSLIEKLVGSITTRTLMNAPCSVLAVPKEAKYEGIKHIAYASDFIPTDSIALEQLTGFSDKVDADLSFVHVDTTPNFGEIKDMISLKAYPFEFSEFYLINNSSILEGIDDFITSKDINLLALFMPKRRLWERLFHQSFSKKYTFHTKVPLLIFHQ
ncbi:MAG: nucleotide-binding universal stress UspA family protein [Paraglaciecola sp.]|jgi:nucleotide-binding universal stress UspA family protein